MQACLTRQTRGYKISQAPAGNKRLMVSHPPKVLEAQAKYKFSSYLYGLQHADV